MSSIPLKDMQSFCLQRRQSHISLADSGSGAEALLNLDPDRLNYYEAY